LEIIQQEGSRLRRSVDDLFTLARADAGDRPSLDDDMFLEELVMECVRALDSHARANGIQLTFSPRLEAPFRGNELLLRRLVFNLIDNAIRHTPDGGTVALDLELGSSEYVLSVQDTGCGIPPDILPRVFERFFR